MPDDLVGDPVEDVEDEEGQGEGCPGDGVYPLGSVHKLLPHGVHVSGDRRLRVWGRGGVFDGRAVLGRRGLAHVAGKIKAAFAHVFILQTWCQNTNTLTLLLPPDWLPIWWNRSFKPCWQFTSSSAQFSVSSGHLDSIVSPLTLCAKSIIYLKTLSTPEQRKWMSERSAEIITGKCIR